MTSRLATMILALLFAAALLFGCAGGLRVSGNADTFTSAERKVPPEPNLRGFRMAPPPTMTSATTVRLVFRTPPLATRLAVLEACVRASGQANTPGCAPIRTRLGAAGRAHLQRFGAARARFLSARVAPRAAPLAAHPLGTGLLPPVQLQAAEAFAEPFFRFNTLAEVLADLRLPEVDRRLVEDAFAWFAPSLDLLCASLARAAPEAALAQVARWARLDAFLAQMASFYGVSAHIRHRLSVDLVWSPAHRSRATAWARRAVVPVNETMFPRVSAARPGVAVRGFDRAGLARTLGVVVHEFGHTFASLLPRARRQAMTNRIAGEAGVLNRRHANVLDEAVQTAAGNVLFVRSLPAWTAVDHVLYAHEPGQPWPAAIDRLARHLAPVLAKHLATAAAFDGPFLDAALARHVAVFGRPPLAFARACVVVSDSSPAKRWWQQLLPGLNQRTVDPHALAKHATWLQANPWLTRWFLARAPSSKGAPAWTAEARSPALEAALACVQAGSAGCFVARQRGSAAGWDLALVATGDGGLRRLLVRLLHRRSLRRLRLPQPATPVTR